MGNCEICNKKVYEKSLIFINDKFICLNCDDNHEIEFNHNKKFIDLLNEKINLLDNIENKYFHYLGGNFGVHVIFLKNRTLFFYNDITDIPNPEINDYQWKKLEEIDGKEKKDKN